MGPTIKLQKDFVYETAVKLCLNGYENEKELPFIKVCLYNLQIMLP